MSDKLPEELPVKLPEEEKGALMRMRQGIIEKNDAAMSSRDTPSR